MQDTPMQTGKPGVARKSRLVVTYWMKDPAAWAHAFGLNMPDQRQAGIEATRVKWKYHPRRHATHPYQVTITAKVDDCNKARTFMRAQLQLGRQVGVELTSVRNRWYP